MWMALVILIQSLLVQVKKVWGPNQVSLKIQIITLLILRHQLKLTLKNLFITRCSTTNFILLTTQLLDVAVKLIQALVTIFTRQKRQIVYRLIPLIRTPQLLMHKVHTLLTLSLIPLMAHLAKCGSTITQLQMDHR